MNRWIALLAAAVVTSTAFAGDLPKGTVVRIEGAGIEGGWHQGKITVLGEGCTYVALDKPTGHGYKLISLTGALRLQRQQNGAWTEMPLDTLRSHEPKPCLVEGSD